MKKLQDEKMAVHNTKQRFLTTENFENYNMKVPKVSFQTFLN